ncbi:MAG: hypothetical protein GEV07_25135 [Streptosporangiales bacterium]|nr:hypothetical protein [Streptosporangiales bacterium]
MTQTPRDPTHDPVPARPLALPPSPQRRAATEVTRLRRELATCRLHCANLLAAIYAALSAADDGEADPLMFLRDELPERTPYTRVRPSAVERGEGGCR